jgi:hypothetical protein
MVNRIEEMATQNSSTTGDSLYVSTLFLSFTVIFYGLHYLKQKLDALEEKSNKVEETVDEDFYQAWHGTYADGDNSLLIHIARQKVCSKENNKRWLSWDGSDDASTISRNFSLGNGDPTFNWQVVERENDVHGFVRDTMTDGWNSAVHMKLDCFLSEEGDSMNAFVKDLIAKNKIEWHKVLLSDEQFNEIFSEVQGT